MGSVVKASSKPVHTPEPKVTSSNLVGDIFISGHLPVQCAAMRGNEVQADTVSLLAVELSGSFWLLPQNPETARFRPSVAASVVSRK